MSVLKSSFEAIASTVNAGLNTIDAGMSATAHAVRIVEHGLGFADSFLNATKHYGGTTARIIFAPLPIIERALNTALLPVDRTLNSLSIVVNKAFDKIDGWLTRPKKPRTHKVKAPKALKETSEEPLALPEPAVA